MSRAGNTLESAGTGAATGAVAGSIVPGLGTAGGALIGGAAGGLYGYFKNKSLADMLAGSGTDIAGLLAGPGASLAQQAQYVDAAGQWGLTGNGPSAAQAMLESERAGANQRALSTAKSMAGGNPALAATLASNQAAHEQQAALNQATQLRAAEQQAALKTAIEGRNQITQGEQAISNAAIQGDQENAKRKGGFMSGLLSGGLGGFGKLGGGLF